MAVKLALLQSGETVITDVYQKVDQDDRVVSVVFKNPFCVELVTPSVDFDAEAGEVEKEYAVRFYKWQPLTKETDINVNPTWVVSYMEPDDSLKSSYEDRMNEDELEEGETLVDNFEVLNG
tara:strand:+ start:79 stop:441 length:363 start_codon:yes stop_codon:yes gene_type:complete